MRVIIFSLLAAWCFSLCFAAWVIWAARRRSPGRSEIAAFPHKFRGPGLVHDEILLPKSAQQIFCRPGRPRRRGNCRARRLGFFLRVSPSLKRV